MVLCDEVSFAEAKLWQMAHCNEVSFAKQNFGKWRFAMK
jgi:hypothetical protein